MQEAIPQGAKRKQLCEIEETKKKKYIPKETNKQREQEMLKTKFLLRNKF